MKWTLILELVIGALFVIFVVSQLIVPAVKGTPFFPILRAKRRAASQVLAEATEEKEVDEVLQTAHAVWPGNEPSGPAIIPEPPPPPGFRPRRGNQKRSK